MWKNYTILSFLGAGVGLADTTRVAHKVAVFHFLIPGLSQSQQV